MSSLSRWQRRERTIASNKVASQTLNSPGIYQPLYGKNTTTVGGRGMSGNPSSPGNVANYNAAVPGNVAGYNPPVGGNQNPPSGTAFYTTYAQGKGNFPPYYSTSSGSAPIPLPAPYSTYFDSTNNSANYNGSYTTVDYGYSPGNYNPSTPGSAYYNPALPGNANYNPPVVGNAGTPATILGVYFPGGVAGSVAPVVGDTIVNVPYVSSGVPITVPSGGYVIIKQK